MRWLTLVLVFLVGCSSPAPTPKPVSTYTYNPVVATDNEFIGKVKLNDNISIRLLVLKHCPDAIGNTDSNQAVEAVNVAASKGLTIKDIGNFHINKEGRTQGAVWNNVGDLDGLKKFVSEQMKVDAKPGDTLIIYTIGHGGGDGTLMRLGQRAPFMKILAEAAEENNQETFWWQLSCHAGARLPEISTLTERQQELFSMTASSPGNELSYFCTQAALMQKVFNAMSSKSADIDPDQDGTINAGELRSFMIKTFGNKRGSLLFARADDEPIFGLTGGLPNRIPIIDRNNPQKEYPKDYVPLPRKD